MDKYFKNTKLKGMKKAESEQLLADIKAKIASRKPSLLENDKFYRLYWMAAAALFLLLVLGNVYVEKSYFNYTVREFHVCPDTACRLEIQEMARQMGIGNNLYQRNKDRIGGQNG